MQELRERPHLSMCVLFGQSFVCPFPYVFTSDWVALFRHVQIALHVSRPVLAIDCDCDRAACARQLRMSEDLEAMQYRFSSFEAPLRSEIEKLQVIARLFHFMLCHANRSERIPAVRA